MASTFHRFAELRVFVWHVALEDDNDGLNDCGRVIELHHYNSSKSEIKMAISLSYSTLFEINREARLEAAEAGGGEWTTVSARFDGREEPKGSTNFEIYINFSHDIIFLSTRFTFTNARRRELERYHPNESIQLKLAFEVLSTKIIGKITHLVLGTIRNSSTRLWSGVGLESFSSLKRIHLISGNASYNEDSIQEITGHLHKHWACQDPPIPHLTAYPNEVINEPPEDMVWLL
ncbi:hypothetical protein G6011_00717 [Alternaria panax]|uniref:Uncharacterized protein n=1 Tax=Alternaria panax TaxID=48097 RepID=A0AAD4IIL9_9PLEO|nr:hypothetical protein G6011_00717 [Alternaria panax]